MPPQKKKSKKKKKSPKKIKPAVSIAIEKQKPFWWEEERIDTEKNAQEYDDEFFVPYVNDLTPKIPADYKDPILDEEWKLLTEPTDDFPNASMGNMNFGRLFKHYDDNIMPKQGKDWLVGVCIPSGNGMMALNCGVALSTMYKPRHRIHTVQGHNIGILRNMLVNMALANRDTTHVMFVDSDNVLPPYAMMRMLRRNLDIVVGIYTMKTPPYVPLVIKRPLNKEGKKKYNFYVDLGKGLLNRVFPIDAAGAGCLLIKREVLEKMGPPWFQVSPQEHGLSAVGEDLFFFDRAIEMGYTPMMDTTVQCDHVAGGVSYPQVFFQQHAVIGPRSAETVTTWNRNAILWALDLPFYKKPKPPEQPPAPVVPPTGELPVSVDKVETVGDARSVTK